MYRKAINWQIIWRAHDLYTDNKHPKPIYYRAVSRYSSFLLILICVLKFMEELSYTVWNAVSTVDRVLQMWEETAFRVVASCLTEGAAHWAPASTSTETWTLWDSFVVNWCYVTAFLCHLAIMLIAENVWTYTYAGGGSEYQGIALGLKENRVTHYHFFIYQLMHMWIVL